MIIFSQVRVAIALIQLYRQYTTEHLIIIIIITEIQYVKKKYTEQIFWTKFYPKRSAKIEKMLTILSYEGTHPQTSSSSSSSSSSSASLSLPSSQTSIIHCQASRASQWVICHFAGGQLDKVQTAVKQFPPQRNHLKSDQIDKDKEMAKNSAFNSSCSRIAHILPIPNKKTNH